MVVPKFHGENSNSKWNFKSSKVNTKEVERILTHQRYGRRTHMQSRIRNGRTRKETNSEPVLANSETGGKREVLCVLECSNNNGEELNGDLYQGRKNWLVRWHRSARSGSG